MKKRAAKKEPGLEETYRQRFVVRWAKFQEPREPRLALLHAIPNEGKRGFQVAARMKAEGLKAGVPDLDLPCYSHDRQFCGLHIEMKRPTTYANADQKWWLEQLAHQGRKAIVCHTEDEAVDTIRTYLGRLDLPALNPIR